MLFPRIDHDYSAVVYVEDTVDNRAHVLHSGRKELDHFSGMW